MAGEDWTDAENDLIVADYFEMLAADVARRPYVKAEHNRALQQRIGRSRTSIEFKHQNISAVLAALGEPWINGYKPAVNFQDSLVAAVERWLRRNPDWLNIESLAGVRPRLGTGEPGLLRVEYAPPPLGDALTPEYVERVRAAVRHFDAAQRDERNRALGAAGEERVFEHEKAVLANAGRDDLARQVRWTSQEDGDGAGYDIGSFAPDGRPRLLEVKTTCGRAHTPFYITRNELAAAAERREDWRLVRLWDFARGPRAFELSPPLEPRVRLEPTVFQAGFPRPERD